MPVLTECSHPNWTLIVHYASPACGTKELSPALHSALGGRQLEYPLGTICPKKMKTSYSLRRSPFSVPSQVFKNGFDGNLGPIKPPLVRLYNAEQSSSGLAEFPDRLTVFLSRLAVFFDRLLNFQNVVVQPA